MPTRNLLLAVAVAQAVCVAALGAAADDRHTGVAREVLARAVFSRAVAADLGTAGPPDAPRAFALYRQAAAVGLPEAQMNVAIMYDIGRGTPRDAAQAATWYAQAAIGGIPRAAFDLGQLYQTGDGVPRNPGLARAWFVEAVQQGISAASGREANIAVDDRRPIEAPATSYPPVDSKIQAPVGGLALVWTSTATPAPAEYFVQVMGLDAHEPIPAFTTTTPLSAVRMPGAQPGRYAWRVFVLCPSLGRYVPSAWTAFSIN